MGTYIKKILGYGLEMKAEEGSIILNKEALNRLNHLDSPSYLEFLKGKYPTEPEVPSDNLAYYLNDLHIGEKSKSKFTAANLVTVVDNQLQVEENYSVDSRLWVVITPLLTHQEWKHNDDPIDFAENIYKYQDEETFQFEFSMKFFNQGFFPYDGGYINHATGENPDADMVIRLKRYLHATASQIIPTDDMALRLLLASVGVSSVGEFKSLIHPAPPISVIDIAEWSGVFKDSAVIQRLRPVLLTYWS